MFDEKDFISAIHNSIFESGFTSEAYEYTEEQLQEDPEVTVSGIYQLFIDNYFFDVKVINGIMHVLAHLDYEEIGSAGLIMATFGLNHENAEIAESSIIALERWRLPESLFLLKNFSTEIRWLKDYARKVVDELEKEYGEALSSV